MEVPQNENCIPLRDSSSLMGEKCRFIGSIGPFSENSISQKYSFNGTYDSTSRNYIKKLKFSFEEIPQRDHSNGVCVGFPQSDSESDSVPVEVHVRLTERTCITTLKVNLNPLVGKYCPPNG